MPAVDGILVVNKPQRITSNGSLTHIKLRFPRLHRPRVGHAGTLDPFATGVLLVLLGSATKHCERLMGQPKRYLATIKLGATTPTLDPTVPELPADQAGQSELPGSQPAVCDLTFQISDLKSPISDIRSQIQTDILPRFVGTILQSPPAFSALKIAGRPAYFHAVRGRHVSLEPRPVTIHSIDLVSYEYPYLKLDICCGRGTYIRALARDIAAALGTVGYLTQLTRMAVGPYTLEQSVPLKTLTHELILEHLVAPQDGRDRGPLSVTSALQFSSSPNAPVSADGLTTS